MRNIYQEGKMFFATSYREDEINVLKEAKPKNILASHAMWKTKKKDYCLKKRLIDRIGYTPDLIYIDCGSFSYGDIDLGLDEMIETYVEMKEEDFEDWGEKFTFDIDNPRDLMYFIDWYFREFDEDSYLDNRTGFSPFQQYIHFLYWNDQYYDYCFSFDVLGDNEVSLQAYKIMKAMHFPVIPVFQATNFICWDDGSKSVSENCSDYDILDYYASQSDYIAIGGTAIRNAKGYTKSKRIEIVRNIIAKYPDKKFHLLGTLDDEIIEACPELYSFDGQCWLQKVRKGEGKVEKSVRYIQNKINWFDERKREDSNQFIVTKKGQISFCL